MTLKQQVLADLDAAACAPLHRFGQNFMIDERVLADLRMQVREQQQRANRSVSDADGVLDTVAAAVRAHCEERLARFKQPQRVEVVDELGAGQQHRHAAGLVHGGDAGR